MAGDDEVEARGWKAIDGALDAIYKGQEPKHWGTIVPYSLGGKDPLTGISAYRSERGRPHWHFVTYGFSELYEKEEDDPEVSGFGFELTFRLVRGAKEREPPIFAVNFLMNLARYVFQSGNGFGPGHTLPLNGPIQAGSNTLIHAASFLRDPELGSIQTPNGKCDFLQIVGLTMDELRAMLEWNAEAFLQLMAKDDPLLITDLKRESKMENAAFAAEVAARTEAEGASSGMVYWSSLEVKEKFFGRGVIITTGALVVEDFKLRLVRRLPYGRNLVCEGKSMSVEFAPGEKFGWELEDDLLRITMPEGAAEALAESLKVKAGDYPLPGEPRIVLRIERTEVKDNEGRVLEVVG